MNCKHNFDLVSKAWAPTWKGWMLRCTKCDYTIRITYNFQLKAFDITLYPPVKLTRQTRQRVKKITGGVRNEGG
jgi:hypothetical protein